MPDDTPASPSSPVAASNRRTRDSGQPASSLAAFVLLLLGAAAAMFLAGGAEQGNLGVFLLFAGTALVACPPRATVKWTVWLAAAAFLLCGTGALLPAHLFHVLTWRQGLADVPDLPLPDTVSAAPAQTAFWLAVLTVTVLTGLFTLTQPVRSRGLLTLALAAVGVCGTYAALSIYARLSGWQFPFSGGAIFGFFPNRNHTATLLITGSLLSVGILGVAFRERRWLSADWAVAALILCVAGLLFFSTSRAGVVFLVVGLLVWLAGLGGSHRDRPLLLAVVLVVLAGGGLFLFLKSDARDRLLGTQTTAHNPAFDGLSNDDRLRIYHDTLGMVRDAPLTGTGLGTFTLLFPFYRQSLVSDTTVLHPESDWLMVAAEMGLPALAGLAALGFLVLRRWRPAREHPYWPLRWGFLVAALAGLLHGIVDVPLHRAALGWWLLVLAGLALQPGRSPGGAPWPGRAANWLARGVFVLGGLLAWGLGIQLVRAQWFGAPPLPPYVADRAAADLLQAFKQGNETGELDAAFAQAHAAVRASPLDPGLCYQLGAIGLRIDDAEPEVDRAFRIQRLLSPYPAVVPRAQGVGWLGYDSARAARLFADSLTRQERLLHADPHEYQNLAEYWDQLVQRATLSDVQRLMWEPSVARGSVLILAWLDGANADVVKERLPSLAADDQFLDRLDPAQRQQFLSLWQRKGDPAALRTFQETHGPAWLAGKAPGS